MSNSNQPDVRRGVLAWPNFSPKIRVRADRSEQQTDEAAVAPAADHKHLGVYPNPGVDEGFRRVPFGGPALEDPELMEIGLCRALLVVARPRHAARYIVTAG
jgi:hypothetical protein